MNLLDRLDTTLRVVGGARLEGSVDTHGAKNAALPIMAAALMAKGKVTLHRVPRITDVSVMWSLLEALGARLSLDGPNTITIDASNVATYRAPWTLVRKLAASFDVVGPLLGRFGRAELGATVTNEHGYLIAQAAGKHLQGGDIEFRLPSVGATKNAMLAAVLARGTTTIRNAAMEPEVVDLANFLIAMGACIEGVGGDTLRIDGVRELHGVEYTIIADRIVTGTLLHRAGTWKLTSSLPVFRSQSLSVRSLLAERAVRPSVLTATPLTPSRCPFKVRIQRCPWRTSCIPLRLRRFSERRRLRTSMTVSGRSCIAAMWSSRGGWRCFRVRGRR